mmetsp:Transcript_61473/g.146905  ORF Transcript_61473/g.146905 Transcript_61473/m.146905 type:complete len:239 (-) Transcript_61473:63-779(-)
MPAAEGDGFDTNVGHSRASIEMEVRQRCRQRLVEAVADGRTAVEAQPPQRRGQQRCAIREEESSDARAALAQVQLFQLPQSREGFELLQLRSTLSGRKREHARRLELGEGVTQSAPLAKCGALLVLLLLEVGVGVHGKLRLGVPLRFRVLDRGAANGTSSRSRVRWRDDAQPARPQVCHTPGEERESARCQPRALGDVHGLQHTQPRERREVAISHRRPREREPGERAEIEPAGGAPG